MDMGLQDNHFEYIGIVGSEHKGTYGSNTLSRDGAFLLVCFGWSFCWSVSVGLSVGLFLLVCFGWSVSVGFNVGLSVGLFLLVFLLVYTISSAQNRKMHVPIALIN
jgi:hypothetical protein